MKTDLLNSILTIAAHNQKTVCVFDLDSTLFNVSPRTQQILNEFADQYKSELKTVEILHTDWGLREALNRAGFYHNDHPELHQKIRDFWVERFFSNEYLHYDIPYLGAVSFVQRLSQTDCEIHYLTGRDVQRMGKGTEEVLIKWGFPLNTEKTFLHLKPHRDLDDHTFKTEFMQNLFPLKDHPIYFFENEPVNINALGAKRPDINIIYLDTTHSRQQTVSVPVQTIKNFTLNTTSEN